MFPNAEQHLRSRLRLANLYPEEALAETMAIARLCNFSLDSLRYEYPDELVPEGYTPSSYLREQTWVGAHRRFPKGIPAPVQQQTLVGPTWMGGGPKIKSGQWRTFNDTANLDTNAGYAARLSAANRSSSVKSVSFRFVGDQAQVRAILKPGASSGSFTLVESSPAVPGFTAMSVTRAIKVVK